MASSGLFITLVRRQRAALRQIWAVTAMNLQSLPARLGVSLVIVVGIAGVVGVLVSILAMREGFSRTLEGAGRPDRAIVLRAGDDSEVSSSVPRDAAALLAGLPGLARGRLAAPGAGAAVAPVGVLLAGEALNSLEVRKNGQPGNMALRGVSPAGWAARPEARLVAGRLYRPGLRELVVGRQALRLFDRLALGARVPDRRGAWTVVGVFSTDGDVHESEAWTDADTLLAGLAQKDYQSLLAKLSSPADFLAFRTALRADKRYKLDAVAEPAYYAAQSKQLALLINTLGYTVTVIMAVGALFGALNSLYAAVATRAREIATLRALGFSAAAVVVSVLIEAMALSAAGGLLGGAVAWAAFNGFSVSTLNFSSFSQVSFSLAVTPGLLGQGLGLALGLGLVGGLLPSLRAARLPVAEALRTV